jgi:hypothetical protein
LLERRWAPARRSRADAPHGDRAAGDEARSRRLRGLAAGRPDLLRELERLPEREYRSLDEVGEELAPVQPPRRDEVPHVPHEESGDPPGGEDYANPAPEPGGVKTG